MNHGILLTLGASLLLGGGCVEPPSSDGDAGPTMTVEASSSTSEGTGIDASTETSASVGSSESSTTETNEVDCNGIPKVLQVQDGIDPDYPALASYFADSPQWSCEIADDFVVPDDTCWCITMVRVATSAPETGTPDVQLDIYSDDHELPGDDWYSVRLTPVTIENEGEAPVVRVQTLVLPSPAIATAGRHWIAPKGIDLPSGERYSLFTSGEHEPNESAMGRCGSSFGPDCTTWQHPLACAGGSPIELQLAYELIGVAVDCE